MGTAGNQPYLPPLANRVETESQAIPEQDIESALGIEERKAPLILDEEHWHSDPNDADAARSAFLKVLAIS